MFRKITIKLIILGLIMTINSAAEELRPSQLKSLENIFKKIQQSQEVIDEKSPTANIDDIKARTRELAKIQKSLGRLTKSLQRLPANSEVTKGTTQIQQLNEQLEKKIEDIARIQDNLGANESKLKADIDNLLNSRQAQDDIELMENLGGVFMSAWHASPGKESDSQWDAGVHTEIWDEQEVSSLVYIIKNSQTLFQEVEDLNAQYNKVSKTRQGLKVLGSRLSDLVSYSQKFKESRSKILTVLPRAIETTAQQYYEAYKKEHDNFVTADKMRDKSRMLIMGNPYKWHKTLRQRMKAQMMIYQATGLNDLNKMESLQKDAKDYADVVSRKLLDWQQQQQGEEARELQRQEANQKEQRRKNEANAVEDKRQWDERRKKIDENREARRLRLIELRKVKG